MSIPLRIACILPSPLSGNFNIPLGEPLGLLYIAGVAKRIGCEVEIFIRDHEEMCEVFAERIEQFSPDVLAFSIMTCQAYDAVRILFEIKRRRKDLFSIAGGIHPTLEPEYFLEKGFDICVIGEGEIPFYEILISLNKQKDIKKIKGISFIDEGKLVINAKSPETNLDDLPLPFRKKSVLKGPMIGSLGYPNPNIRNWATIITSRGCPNNCYYCCWPLIYHGKISWRSPQQVVDEMKYLSENYDIDFFRFDDASFNVDPKYTFDLCERIIRSNLSVHWYCMANANNINNDEIISVMKEAGCSLISVGVESTNPFTLARIGKASINEQVARNLKRITKNGIATNVFYMIGFPWQTPEIIIKDADMLNNLDAHKIQIFVATPYPKTPFWYQVKKELFPNYYHLYDSEHLVYKHKYLSPEDIEELRETLTYNFYLNSNYKNRVKSFISKYPRYKETFLHYWKRLPFYEKMKERLLLKSKSFNMEEKTCQTFYP